MKSKLLVTYVSNTGSTAEIARFIGQQLMAPEKWNVDVLPFEAVANLEQYDSVIVGGFLHRFGWHSQAQAFVAQNIEILKKQKTAFFVVGLGMVKSQDCQNLPYPLVLDSGFIHQPAHADRLSGLEQQMTLSKYMKNCLPLFAQIKPVSVGFFAGRLDFQKLSFVEKQIMLILSLLTGLKAGDYRNWELIQNWAAQIDA